MPLANRSQRSAHIALCVLCLFQWSALAKAILEPYAFTTFAGAAPFMNRDGQGARARFYDFRAMAADLAGNVYVLDGFALRKVSPDGVVDTVVRGVFYDVAVNNSGDVYVSTHPDGAILRISSLRTLIPTKLPNGYKIAIDQSDTVYIFTGDQIMKVPPGGDPEIAARVTMDSILSSPSTTDLAVGSDGALYLANPYAGGVYKFARDGTFTLLMNKNSGESSYQPAALASDLNGNVYVSDAGNHQILKLDVHEKFSVLSSWSRFLAEPYTPVPCALCLYTYPYAVAVDRFGNLFVGAQNTLLLASNPGGEIRIVAGNTAAAGDVDGFGEFARFGGYLLSGGSRSLPAGPNGLAVDRFGTAYVSDPVNGSIRKITADRRVTTISRSFPNEFPKSPTPVTLVVDPHGMVFVAHTTTVSMLMESGDSITIAGSSTQYGNVDGPGPAARFGGPEPSYIGYKRGLNAITRDPAGDLYVYDLPNRALKKLFRTETNWMVSTMTNLIDTNGTSVSLSAVSALAADEQGNLFAANGFGLVKLTRIGANWVVSSLAGSRGESGYEDGPGHSARFGGQIGGIAVDLKGNIFVSDTAIGRIRKVAPDGYVRTLAGGGGYSKDGVGQFVGFSHPLGIGVDEQGSLFVADSYNFTVRNGFPAPQVELSTVSMDAGVSVFAISTSTSHGTIEASTNLIDWSAFSTSSAVQISNEKRSSTIKDQMFFRAALGQGD